jgi:GMP synthase-like glutamine amidotransferase
MRAAGAELDERDLKRGDGLPRVGEAEAILALGGDQSVLEIKRYPYLEEEAELLRAEAERGTPVLGVCLGGQLLAHALGGEVERMPQRMVEWSEVRRLPAADGDPLFGGLPPLIRALHWNEDAFQVPGGAVELLSRAGPGGEAFRWGERAWGLQFHPETDQDALAGWYSDVDWLAEAGVEEAAARAADGLHLPGQPVTAEAIFGGFARLVAGLSA